MKATALAIDVAKSAKEAMERINAALEVARKRLVELSQDKEAIQTPRVQDAVTKISAALKGAEMTALAIRRVALGALSLPPQAQVELTNDEIVALTFGLDETTVHNG